MAVVNEAIYLSHRNEVLRFDVEAATGRWLRAVVANGWETNLHLITDPISDAGRAIWSGEVWYTLDRRGR